ncbi:hypothetical protein L0Y59_01940 [Candidatus Uhrbacteria bacterium]|nr:hypothetical protein [Candidatus Uhrbacteria bacterium]
MDTSQAPAPTPEGMAKKQLEETLPSATRNVVEARRSEGVKMESPEDRRAKMEEAEGIRRAIAGLEAIIEEQAGKAEKQEADATAAQEAIGRLVGPHDILAIVRSENAGYAAALSRQRETLVQGLEALEKDLGAVSSETESPPTGPERDVEETSKDLAPDKTSEAAAPANKPPSSIG